MQTGNFYLLRVHDYRDHFLLIDYSTQAHSQWSDSIDDLVLRPVYTPLPSIATIHESCSGRKANYYLIPISNPATIRQDHPELFL